MKKLGVFAFILLLLCATGCNNISPANEGIVVSRTATPTKPVVEEVKPPEPHQPQTDWRVDTQVSQMDGAVTKFIRTSGYVHLTLCFENGKPCNVEVAVIPPSGCFIESNVEGSLYSRRIRVKFDDGKARTEVWGIADGHKAIFPHNARAYAVELTRHKLFLIEFGCDESDPGEVITMNIAGLEDAIKAAGLKLR